MRHVRNVHADFQISVWQRAHVQRIVNVCAARRVNAANLQMAEVAATRQVLILGGPVG